MKSDRTLTGIIIMIFVILMVIGSSGCISISGDDDDDNDDDDFDLIAAYCTIKYGPAQNDEYMALSNSED